MKSILSTLRRLTVEFPLLLVQPVSDVIVSHYYTSAEYLRTRYVTNIRVYVYVCLYRWYD